MSRPRAASSSSGAPPRAPWFRSPPKVDSQHRIGFASPGVATCSALLRQQWHHMDPAQQQKDHLHGHQPPTSARRSPAARPAHSPLGSSPTKPRLHDRKKDMHHNFCVPHRRRHASGSRYQVIWATPSKESLDSMPLSARDFSPASNWMKTGVLGLDLTGRDMANTSTSPVSPINAPTWG